jgi:fibronectin type 3 domain-containing protein
VYEKRFFGLEKIDTVKTTQFSEAGPVKGKTKTYAVTAVDKDGLESEPSEEIAISGR